MPAPFGASSSSCWSCLRCIWAASTRRGQFGEIWIAGEQHGFSDLLLQRNGPTEWHHFVGNWSALRIVGR